MWRQTFDETKRLLILQTLSSRDGEHVKSLNYAKSALQTALMGNRGRRLRRERYSDITLQRNGRENLRKAMQVHRQFSQYSFGIIF